MFKGIVIIIIACLLCGCASPFTSQYQQLNTAYQSGQLTYPEYVQAFQNTQAQEMQWRANMAQTINRANYNMQQQQYQQQQLSLQRQQLYMQQFNQMHQNKNRSSHTNCYRIGNQVHCDTNSY